MTLVLSLTSDLPEVQRGQMTFLGSHRRLPSSAAQSDSLPVVLSA